MADSPKGDGSKHTPFMGQEILPHEGGFHLKGKAGMGLVCSRRERD